MQVTLVMFKSDGTRRDIPLNKKRSVIGRMQSCDLRIPLTSISREHCEVTWDDRTVKFKDLNSSNGVFHNGAKARQGQLLPGDELVVGPVLFTVVVDGKPRDIKPVRTILDEKDERGDERPSAAVQEQKPAFKSDAANDAPGIEVLDEDETDAPFFETGDSVVETKVETSASRQASQSASPPALQPKSPAAVKSSVSEDVDDEPAFGDDTDDDEVMSLDEIPEFDGTATDEGAEVDDLPPPAPVAPKKVPVERPAESKRPVERQSVPSSSAAAAPAPKGNGDSTKDEFSFDFDSGDASSSDADMPVFDFDDEK